MKKENGNLANHKKIVARSVITQRYYFYEEGLYFSMR